MMKTMKLLSLTLAVAITGLSMPALAQSQISPETQRLINEAEGQRAEAILEKIEREKPRDRRNRLRKEARENRKNRSEKNRAKRDEARQFQEQLKENRKAR